MCAWFEEPVSSDDLAGLAAIRESAPAGMEIAAGEYGYTVTIPQDAGGPRGRRAASGCDPLRRGHRLFAGRRLCEAFISIFPDTARRLCISMSPARRPALRHLEWFHDHVRIERMLFDGAPVPRNGADPARPVSARMGLTFKHQDADALRSYRTAA